MDISCEWVGRNWTMETVLSCENSDARRGMNGDVGKLTGTDIHVLFQGKL